MTHTFTHVDGFETKDLSRCVASAGGALELAEAIDSAAAWRWAVTNATGSARWGRVLNANGSWNTVSGNAHTRHAFSIKIKTLPDQAGRYYYLTLLLGAANRFQARITNAGILETLTDGDGGTWRASAQALSVNVEYTIECKNVGGAPSVATVYRRDTGEVVTSVSSVANVNGTGHGWGTLYLGPHTASYGDVIFDNLVCENSATASNIDNPVALLEPRYATTLYIPFAAGDQDQWTNGAAQVKEVPNDGDTSYRVANTNGHAFTQRMEMATPAFGPAPTSTIGAVCAVIYCRSDEALDTEVILRLRSGGTNADTTALSSTASYVCGQLVRTTDPVDSAAWTFARIAEVQVGGVRSSGRRSRCTAAYFDVAFTVRQVQEPAERIVHYTLDTRLPEPVVTDQDGRPVFPEELVPDRLIDVLWKLPVAREYSDAREDPEKAAVTSVKFREPDDFTLGTGDDDLPAILLARLAGRMS